MGKLTISMAIFNSYLKLPEGMSFLFFLKEASIKIDGIIQLNSPIEFSIFVIDCVREMVPFFLGNLSIPRKSIPVLL